MRNRADFENDPLIINAIQRGLIEIHGDRIIVPLLGIKHTKEI